MPLRRRHRRPRDPFLNLLCSQPRRSFIDARVPWVRDRGLDHAVEKEKHLFPFLNVKDLLIFHNSPPPLPLSSISPLSSSLSLPFSKPLRFLRLFPHSFLEEFPPDSPKHPHFRPSQPLLKLHEEEQLIYSSCRLETADRLLRLLMLCPRRRLPLKLLHALRFDLGLPRDFPRSLLPDFPDYFCIVPSSGNSPNDLYLELVLYNTDIAVSQMERYAMRTGDYKKGAALAFPLQYSRGFVMEKKVRKWVDDWQRLPYVSPYEDGSRLPPKSDVWEKWAVGMVHELLSLMVPRKTEKVNLEMVAGHVGLPVGIRKMIFNYPGIFYVSNKLRTQTVVLREAYRRDLLVEKHPLMGLRYQYIHLMRKGKEGSGDGKKKKKKKKSRRGDEGLVDDDEVEEDEDEGDEGDEDGEVSESSDFDSQEDETSDDEDYGGVNKERVMQGSPRIQVDKAVPRRPIVDKHQAMKSRRADAQGRSYGRGNSPRAAQRPISRKRVST